jgi:hypothetical protein
MLEIDFDKVKTDPADEPFYADSDAPVRIPLNMAVRCLNEAQCQDGEEADKRGGLTAWLASRNDVRTPTHWIVLCDDHFEKTKRAKPLI